MTLEFKQHFSSIVLSATLKTAALKEKWQRFYVPHIATILSHTTTVSSVTFASLLPTIMKYCLFYIMYDNYFKVLLFMSNV